MLLISIWRHQRSALNVRLSGMLHLNASLFGCAWCSVHRSAASVSAELDFRVNNSSVGPWCVRPPFEKYRVWHAVNVCWPFWDFSDVVSSVAHLAADHNFPIGFYFQHDAVSEPTISTGKGRGGAHYGNVCGDQSSKIIRCYITECHILWGTEAHPAGINWAHFVQGRKW